MLHVVADVTVNLVSSAFRLFDFLKMCLDSNILIVFVTALLRLCLLSGSRLM